MGFGNFLPTYRYQAMTGLVRRAGNADVLFQAGTAVGLSE